MSEERQVSTDLASSAAHGAFPLDVEKGIPMPAPMQPRRSDRHPFLQMEVGDSFLVVTLKQRKLAATAAWKFSNSKAGKGRTFSSRKLSNGYRFWRTE